MSVAPHPTKSNLYALFIGEQGLGLAPEIYLPEGDKDTNRHAFIRQQYIKYVQHILQLANIANYRSFMSSNVFLI